MLKFILLTTLLGLLSVGCSSGKKSSDSSSDAKRAKLSDTPKTDAEISNGMMTANTQKMNLANVGRHKASNTNVKEFAEKLFNEHASSNDRLIGYSHKNNLVPKETQASRKMKFSSEDKVKELWTKEEKEFDEAFIQAQIEMHEDILDRLDDTLIPNAKGSELKSMLKDSRSRTQRHLNEAKDLKETI